MTIDNEQNYHDIAFKNMIRAEQVKYYSIYSIAFNNYKNSILCDCEQKDILEIGCGPESLAQTLLSKGANITGIDISPVAIELAKTRIDSSNTKVRFYQMDAMKMEFDDCSFDVICGSGILHHLDIDIACDELIRVLKPNGKAVFIEPLGHNPIINIYRRLTPSKRTVDEHPLKRSDLYYIGSRFNNNISVYYFNLITLLAVPLKSKSYFNSVLNVLHSIDMYLIKYIPFMRYWSWITVITVINKP